MPGHDDGNRRGQRAGFEGAAVEPMVLESVTEVSAPSLSRGVTISIDCEADLMARFDPARNDDTQPAREGWGKV